jgi:hypothetical protein
MLPDVQLYEVPSRGNRVVPRGRTEMTKPLGPFCDFMKGCNNKSQKELIQPALPQTFQCMACSEDNTEWLIKTVQFSPCCLYLQNLSLHQHIFHTGKMRCKTTDQLQCTGSSVSTTYISTSLHSRKLIVYKRGGLFQEVPKLSVRTDIHIHGYDERWTDRYK